MAAALRFSTATPAVPLTRHSRSAHPIPVRPPLAAPDHLAAEQPPSVSGSFALPIPKPSISRLLLATLVFAGLYAVCMPAVFLLVMAVFTWELLRWLLFAVMLVPFLLGMGLLGLLRGVLPTGLLVGAIAARTPGRHWPKLLAAATVPLVDLLLLRQFLLPRLLERGSLLLMGHGTLFLLDTVAPLAASLVTAWLIPQRLVRRLLGVRR